MFSSLFLNVQVYFWLRAQCSIVQVSITECSGLYSWLFRSLSLRKRLNLSLAYPLFKSSIGLDGNYLEITFPVTTNCFLISVINQSNEGFGVSRLVPGKENLTLKVHLVKTFFMKITFGASKPIWTEFLSLGGIWTRASVLAFCEQYR